ncbi:MAG: peptidyl-prolyl cis-trans isomerase, partial [Myxococcaceae bacterium]
HARDDAVKVLGKLEAQPEDGKAAEALADASMFQDYYGDRTTTELAKEFGPAFAQEVFRLKTGSWQGPVESAYGWHLVFVDSNIPGRLPAFEEVESEVKTAWLSVRKAEAWQKAYDAMRAKYTVLLPAPPEPGAERPTPSPPKKQVPAPSGEGSL